jgi:hypothetical protein
MGCEQGIESRPQDLVGAAFAVKEWGTIGDRLCRRQNEQGLFPFVRWVHKWFAILRLFLHAQSAGKKYVSFLHTFGAGFAHLIMKSTNESELKSNYPHCDQPLKCHPG